MRINWGAGLVIAMVLFIGFILFFVVQIMTDPQHDYDLVTEDYYSREMVYQEELDAESNSHALANNIVSRRTDDGWVFVFPEEIDGSKVSGKVILYRPSDKKLDYELPLTLTENEFMIPNDNLVAGRWNATVIWDYEGKQYRYTRKFNY